MLSWFLPLKGLKAMAKMLTRTFYIMILLIIISGCASNNSAPVKAFDTSANYQLAPIAIFSNKVSTPLAQTCREFASQSSLNYCQTNQTNVRHYWQEFKESKLFNEVLLADEKTEYSIAIASTIKGKSSAESLSNAVLSGASLMLIPLIEEYKVKTEVSIYWRNVKIKQYAYTLPFINKVSLFSTSEEADKAFAKSLVSHVIADIQQDEILSTAYLTAFLRASDYQKDLKVPSQIANFELSGQYVYNDPLFGSVATYANQAYHNDKIDLYVYPIRKVDITDELLLLNEEVNNIKDEFNSVAKNYQWTDINFSPPKALTVMHGKQSISGIYFQGEYIKERGEKSFTSVYLFKLKDKFVKFRASFPEKFITEQISQVFSQIDVPNESLFMKKLRQQGREKKS